MEKYQQEGIEYLRQQLKQLDPEHYSKVDLRNPNRMLKAIEITLMSGKPYSAHLTATRKERPFNLIKLGLDLPRPQLFERINRRVDKMLESGLVSEVQSLVYAKNENALRTVGYREIFSFIEGEHTLDEAVEQIKTNTRRYAKRQLTWFSRTKEMPWFSPSDFEMIVDYVAKHQQ
jgi:tRNA dimethylallyltransferase